MLGLWHPSDTILEEVQGVGQASLKLLNEEVTGPLAG